MTVGREAYPRAIGSGGSASLRTAMAFLQTIGIPARLVENVDGGFTPNVRISKGCLVVGWRAHVSNVLHEAGHMAVLPAHFRPWMTGNLQQGHRRMMNFVGAMDLDPDSPLMRAVLQSSDPEVTAWAWAAGSHLGLAPSEIVRDADYGGEGEQIRACLTTGYYVGIHGLAHAGFCSVRTGGRLQPYPLLQHWLQPAELPTQRA